MLGNVWEWCADHWHEGYEGAPTDGRAWLDAEAEAGASRVRRGGSWSAAAQYVRCAYRDCYGPDFRDGPLGFRCARVQS